MKRMCIVCKSRPSKEHRNAKYCVQCAAERLKRPIGKLTPAQVRQAKALIHKMPRDEIAKAIGTSLSSLKRWARDNGNIRLAYYNRWHANPKLVRQICEYYSKHGMVRTEKRFPNVRIRSVVERYFKQLGFKPRQVRWRADQIIELAQMAGLVNHSRQARHFNRPGAHEGAIKSAWMKKFQIGGSSMNGLSYCIARHYVRKSCPFMTTDFWAQRKDSRRGGTWTRRLALWVDVDQHLRADVPDHLRQAIKAMAKFQRWLHGRNVRSNVARIIKEVGR